MPGRCIMWAIVPVPTRPIRTFFIGVVDPSQASGGGYYGLPWEGPMASRRTPSGDEVLRLRRREMGEGRYGYAPGRLSFAGIYAQLAIAGAARAPATESALRQTLERLVAA